MESMSAPQSEEEVPKTREELVNAIGAMETRIAELKALSVENEENIGLDVELGSEEYVDFGYMAEAQELEKELVVLNAELTARDDEAAFKTIADAAQRELDI